MIISVTTDNGDNLYKMYSVTGKEKKKTLLSRVFSSHDLKHIFGESRTDVAEDTNETIVELVR